MKPCFYAVMGQQCSQEVCVLQAECATINVFATVTKVP